MKARVFHRIGGLLLLAGTVSVANDLLLHSSRHASLAIPPLTSMRDAWAALHPSSLGASINAVHVLAGVPLALPFIELIASIPVALALFFLGGAAIIMAPRKTSSSRLLANGAGTNTSPESTQPAGKGRALVATAASRQHSNSSKRRHRRSP